MHVMSKADIHIHTSASDGIASVEQVLEHVAASDLRVIAITDHDTLDGALLARRLAPDFGVEVIVGEEVSTLEGHLLALFVEEKLPPGRPASETIAATHAQGGLCIAPHPYDRAVPSLGFAGLHRRCVRSNLSSAPLSGVGSPHDWPLDAIEGFNAGIPWPGSLGNHIARQMATSLGLPIVGGSDAHTLRTVGQGYTLFPGTTADDLYHAIQQGLVKWGGRGWSLSQHLDFVRQTVRRRSLQGALRLARTNLAIRQGDASRPGTSGG
jgi:predicted metal-dependent phosphoesterase TrpH